MKKFIDILFVTEELYPYTNGGIGRIVEQLTKSSLEHGHSFKVLLLTSESLEDQPEWLIVQDPSKVTNQFAYPTLESFHSSNSHELSLRIWFIIRELLEKYTFRYIEFPDFKGLGFSTINELALKADRPSFVTRVHSSDFSLRLFDAQFAGNSSPLFRYTTEAAQLRNSDFIVSHLMGVSQNLVQNVSQILGDRHAHAIEKKIENHLPHLEYLEPWNEINKWNSGNIVFSSKIQFFKNPEFFVRACSLFIKRNRHFDGKIIILANPTDWALTDRLKDLIPSEIESKFVFLGSLSHEERLKIITGSLSIFPSHHESLCLAAYEASSAGAIPLLNSKCVAFSDNSPWIDELNCVKFDGTILNLVERIEFVYQKEIDLKPVCTNMDTSCFYCEKLKFNFKKTIGRNWEIQPISLVIAHMNMADFLEDTIFDVLPKLRPNDEIIVVDDGSNNSSIQNVREICKIDSRISLLEIESNVGLSAARNFGIRNAKNEVVVILDSDDHITSEFVEASRQILEAQIQVLVPNLAMFSFKSQQSRPDELDFVVVEGIGFLPGVLGNKLGSATIAASATLLKRIPYSEHLNSLEDWMLMVNLNIAGAEIRVFERVGLYYRTRVNSLVRRTSEIDHARYVDQVRSRFAIPAYAIGNLIAEANLSVANLYLRKNQSLLAKFLIRYRKQIISIFQTFEKRFGRSAVLNNVFFLLRRWGRKYVNQ